MKLSGLALQHHRLFHFPQQLVMKKIGLNTANIEIKVELIEGLYSICGSLLLSLNSNISRVCCFPYIVCIALNSPGFWQKVKAPKGSLIPQAPAKIYLHLERNPSILH